MHYRIDIMNYSASIINLYYLRFVYLLESLDEIFFSKQEILSKIVDFVSESYLENKKK